MKIGIITLAYGEKFKKDIKYGKQTLINYCNKHGYDLLEDEDMVKKHDREIQWTKILLIQKYLQNKDPFYDYLIWIDADIIILNPEKKIEDFITRLMNNKHIMYSKDFGNWVNNGVIFIKNTKESFDYFVESWNHTNEICREQGSMDMLYRINWNNCKSYIEITEDPREYNPVWFQYEYGMFLMHFPGCGESQRKPNSLKIMMDMFCPLKMDEETDETYLERIRWLKDDAERELKYKKQLCIQQGWKYLPIDLD
jgi:hypothetical protein